jgi:DDE superfamily endonuclease
MLNLPSDLMTVIVGFAPLFSKRVWLHAQVLLVGAILAPGKRTVTSALRAMGMSTEQHFQNYHRFLNRAIWSSREASRILLRLLIATFSPSGTIVLGLDDTLERRRGAKDFVATQVDTDIPSLKKARASTVVPHIAHVPVAALGDKETPPDLDYSLDKVTPEGKAEET